MPNNCKMSLVSKGYKLKTLAYSYLILGFLFIAFERYIHVDSLLECFVFVGGFFSALGGSIGLLMAAQLCTFVLKGFLT